MHIYNINVGLWPSGLQQDVTLKNNIVQLQGASKVHSQWPVITYLTPGCLMSIAPAHHLYKIAPLGEVGDNR
jgi:hypothetical protein